MADRDDRDTSLSGGRSTSSGGSYAGQDRAPSTASSNRNSGSNGYGFGGGGATAHSVERGIDRSLSGGTASPSTSAHGSERGRDFSLGRTTSTPTSFQGSGGTSGRVGVNPDRFGGTTPTRGTARVTNDLPTGFNPARLGDTIRASLNNPIGYDPITGMVGSAVQRGAVNPNIDPSRFGAAATPTGLDPARLGDPTAGTSLPSTGLPTGMDPARFGGAVEPTAGVNVGRFGYEVPTSVAGPRTRGLGTAADVAPNEMPNQPTSERFGGLPTGYPAGPDLTGQTVAGPVGPVEAIQSATSPTGTVATPTVTDAPRVKGELADFKMDGDPAPNTEISDAVRGSVRAVMGPDWEVYGTSGKRAKGQGAPGRHSLGIALDFAVRNTKTGQVLDYHKKADAAKFRDIAEYSMRNYGVQGVGVGSNYMSGTHMHLDLASKSLNPKTQGKQWMDAKNHTQRWDSARQAYTKTGPPTAQAPQQSVASMMASPAERTPQMAALDALSGAGGTNTQIGRGTDPTTTSSTAAAPASTTPASRSTPAAAGGRVTAEAPGTNNFPATPPSQAQAEGFPSFKTPATGYQRSGLGTVLAALGDAVIPAPFQAGAMLLTGDTVMGNVWDASHGKYGPNQYAPGKDDRYSGDRGTVGSGGQATRGVNNPTTIGSTPTVAPTPTGATPTAPTAEEFVSRYIDPKYPTPFENWGEAFGWKEPV